MARFVRASQSLQIVSVIALSDALGAAVHRTRPARPGAMNGELALLLAQDGIATGAIYVLVALGIVLVFLVTRVIFVPFGDLVAYASLTLAQLEAGAGAGHHPAGHRARRDRDAVRGRRARAAGALHRLPRALLRYLVLPLVPAAIAWGAGRARSARMRSGSS